MTISQRMTQGQAVERRLVLGIVALVAFAAGSAFGIVAHDALPLSASQAQVAPRAMAAAGAAESTALGPWELYQCEGCPDAAGIVRYFTGATSSQGPWELYHCEGCPDADGMPHNVSARPVK